MAAWRTQVFLMTSSDGGGSLDHRLGWREISWCHCNDGCVAAERFLDLLLASLSQCEEEQQTIGGGFSYHSDFFCICLHSKGKEK